MKDIPMKQVFGKRSIGGWQIALGALGLLALGASVHATQTVTPTKADGTTVLSGNVAVPAGSAFTFLGMYTDDSAGPESGLGLKVKYNPAHLTNVVVSEEYTKCRIAAAQVQPLTASTAQAVMGWVDTSVRSAGAVGWPDLADTVAGGATTSCLNPGSINTDTAAGTATAPGQKLFKITGTMAAGCTSAGACTSTVLFDSEGNFSYAPASGAGFTNKSFTIVGAAAATCNLNVDGIGGVTPFSDGLLLLRNMLGLTGTALTSGISTNPSEATVTANINAIKSLLDIDGDGAVTPFRDGILLLRMMLNLTGPALTNGVTFTGSTRSSSTDLVNYVNSTCGTAFAP